MAEKYHVVQPIMSSGPERWHTAIHISTHKTVDSAYKHIDKNIRELKKLPGYKTSYLDWHVVDDEYNIVFPTDVYSYQ